MVEANEGTLFVVDEVSDVIKDSVVENCLTRLCKLAKPFKYIVTCAIMQKNGAGFHAASSCYWENLTDGSCTVRWENKTMYDIVSVFGLAIYDKSNHFCTKLFRYMSTPLNK